MPQLRDDAVLLLEANREVMLMEKTNEVWWALRREEAALIQGHWMNAAEEVLQEDTEI